MGNVACGQVGCSALAARRCYFCPNTFCIDHISVTSAGAICQACSAAEQQEQARQAQEAAAAQAKASGCLLLLVTAGLWLLVGGVHACFRRAIRNGPRTSQLEHRRPRLPTADSESG